MARVILVEDDLALRLGLTESLRSAGHAVTAVPSAEEARIAAAENEPDLVILDWNLPGESGLELLCEWRRRGARPRVIMVTARDAVEDRVRGLESGAQDYLIKPFATEELLARIQVQLRDAADVRHVSEELQLEDCRVDLARQIVHRDGQRRPLTAQEARTLSYLASHPGRTVSRVDLLREVWGHRALVQTRAVDNTVYRLRAKVESDPAEPRHLITAHGEGYRFEPGPGK